MSDQDVPPPSPADQLSALARAFYASRPPLAEESFSRLPGFYGARVQPFRAAALGRALAPLFARRHVQRAHLVNGMDERRTLARRRREDPSKADYVSSEDFVALVADVVCNMPAPPRSASNGVVGAARHSRRLAEHGTRSPWVREVARAVAAELPAMADLGVTLYRDGKPEAGRWSAERRAEYDRTREGRRPPAPEALAIAEAWCTDWRDRVGPGAYKTSAVYTSYVAEVPEDDQVTRPRFHPVAVSVLGEPVRRSAGRFYVFPEPAVIAEVAERVARLAWEDQRAILLRIVRREHLAAAAVEEARAA
ncbi:hypothetical protein [Micromonospora sp. NPDC000729]|uniref:hypothetical protein n=1 Tax=Micromonospora sp. NPDC000729 TaxID=3364220 RepID=UPI003682D26D